MNDSDLLKWIDLLYESTQDASRWTGFLEAVCGSLNASMGNLILGFKQPEQTLATFVGPSGPDREAYFRHYCRIDPWLSLAASLPVTTVAASHSVVSDSEYHATEFYNDYGKQQKYDYGLGVKVYASARKKVFMGIMREAKYGKVSEQELALVRPLVPHLHRAVELHDQFSLLELQRNGLLDCMDQLARGLVLLDGTGHILASNRAAEAMAAQGDGVTLGRTGLSAATTSETIELQEKIAQAARTSMGNGMSAGGVMTLSRPSGKRAWIVMVSPHRMGPASAMASVLISDPESKPEPSAQVISRLWGFTPAEARLAVLLAQGTRVEDAAEELHISINTARTHVQRMLEKAGVKRQVALVLLLNKIPSQRS